jgi:addiction module RelE/StbE family toxin
MIVRFTDEALQDLVLIRAYLAEHSPRAADRIGQRLVAAADSLEEFPERGAQGLVDGTREITTVWPYVMVYRVTASEVQILRVWHGAQDRPDS